ncbi:MAG: type II 3-dehydroquinate dehydratase [Bacteroidota bacterium]
MKQFLIINGPNLNLLGKREPSIYGHQDFESFFTQLQEQFPEFHLSYFQSNSEGALIDQLHKVGFTIDGIVINGGAYSHTSIAIADAIAAIPAPVVEVHISNVYAREAFRHHSHFTKVCIGMITGLGMKGYELGLRYLMAL